MKKNFILTGLKSLLCLCLCLIVFPGLLWAAPSDKKSKTPAKTEPVNQSAAEKAGLTVNEIIKLKEAGISEATIQLLIKERQLPQNVKERAFANEHMGPGSVKDAPDRAVIIYSTGATQKRDFYDAQEYGRALDMLRVLQPILIPSTQEPSLNK